MDRKCLDWKCLEVTFTLLVVAEKPGTSCLGVADQEEQGQ